MNSIRAREYLERFARLGRISAIPTEGEPTILFPRTYSLMDDADAALDVVARTVGHALGGAPVIWLDQRSCTTVDLCAESLHCALAYFIRAIGTDVRVMLPRSRTARNRVAAFGIPSVSNGHGFNSTSEYRLLPLQQIMRPQISARDATDDEEVSTRFLTMLSRRLGGFRLRPVVSHFLGQFFNEAVGNAMTHGGDDWWVSGYFRQGSKRRAAYCYLTVFNFGDTIAETLRQLSASSVHRRQIEGLELHHQENGLFNEGWTPEALWMLAGLQPGISRQGDDSENGFGTSEMMRLVGLFREGMRSHDRPRMCFLSGNTQIIVDGTYSLVPTVGMPYKAGEFTAFNGTNDLRLPPDPRFVRTSPNSFPGTLVSLGLHLGSHHLEPIEEG